MTLPLPDVATTVFGAAAQSTCTVIRGVLLPATMALLGKRNWYLPRWLKWLPSSEPHDALALPGGTVAHAGI